MNDDLLNNLYTGVDSTVVDESGTIIAPPKDEERVGSLSNTVASVGEYVNSPARNGVLDLSDFAEDVKNSPDALFNASEPQYYKKREQPHHRLFIELKACGLSNVEIAKRTGYTPACVSDTLKQPWARERLLGELRKNGRDEVLNVFQANASDLAWTLVEIAQNDKNNASSRVAAIQEVHNRLMGKPNQPMTHVNIETKKLSDDEMLQYLESIRAKQ